MGKRKVCFLLCFCLSVVVYGGRISKMDMDNGDFPSYDNVDDRMKRLSTDYDPNDDIKDLMALYMEIGKKYPALVQQGLLRPGYGKSSLDNLLSMTVFGQPTSHH